MIYLKTYKKILITIITFFLGLFSVITINLLLVGGKNASDKDLLYIIYSTNMMLFWLLYFILGLRIIIRMIIYPIQSNSRIETQKVLIEILDDGLDALSERQQIDYPTYKLIRKYLDNEQIEIHIKRFKKSEVEAINS